MCSYWIRGVCVSLFLFAPACADGSRSDDDELDALDVLSDSDEIDALSLSSEEEALFGVDSARDEDATSSATSPSALSGPECPQRYNHPLPGPLLHVAFAFYGNAHRIHKIRHGSLPGTLIRAAGRNSWVPINTLGGDYSVWSHLLYTQMNFDRTKGWWNKPDKQLWIYDDTSPKHLSDEPNMNYVQDGRSCGFVYMGGDFRNDLGPPNLPGDVTYFYEVYDSGTYAAWHDNFGARAYEVPVFNISGLSHDCIDLDTWRQFTKPNMFDAVTYRYTHNKGNKAIYIGLFSDGRCPIGPGAGRALKRTLNKIQDRLNNLSN